jgi:hypothetical protein
MDSLLVARALVAALAPEPPAWFHGEPPKPPELPSGSHRVTTLCRDWSLQHPSEISLLRDASDPEIHWGFDADELSVIANFETEWNLYVAKLNEHTRQEPGYILHEWLKYFVRTVFSAGGLE